MTYSNLGEVLRELKEDTGLSLDKLSVLAAKNDPFRQDTPAGHRDGKCFTESTFVIIGTDRDRKTGALLALLARADEQGLAYAGSAFIALSGNERDELRSRLEASGSDAVPLADFGYQLMNG